MAARGGCAAGLRFGQGELAEIADDLFAVLARYLGIGGILLDFVDGGLGAAVDRQSRLGALGFRLDRDLLSAVAGDTAPGERRSATEL